MSTNSNLHALASVERINHTLNHTWKTVLRQYTSIMKNIHTHNLLPQKREEFLVFSCPY